MVALCSKTITFEDLDGQVAAYLTPKSCQKEAKADPKGSQGVKDAKRRVGQLRLAMEVMEMNGNEWKLMEINGNALEIASRRIRKAM